MNGIQLESDFFNKQVPPENILIFLHLEKTAGTTVTHFFRKIFENDESAATWCSYPKLIERCEQNINFLSELRIICGHFEYGVHRFFKDRSPLDLIGNKK